MVVNFVRNYCFEGSLSRMKNVLANVFNEVAVVSLLHFEGRCIVFFLDLATRFSTAGFIKRLKSTVVIDYISHMDIFGAPKRFINDSSSFFKSYKFKSMCDLSNIVFVSASTKGLSNLYMLLFCMIKCTPHTL